MARVISCAIRGKVAHYGALHVKDEQPHLIRESVWWAIGLLLRNKNDDAARGGQILEACLHWQFNEPGQPYHGTFHRSPQEKLRPPKTRSCGTITTRTGGNSSALLFCLSWKSSRTDCRRR